MAICFPGAGAQHQPGARLHACRHLPVGPPPNLSRTGSPPLPLPSVQIWALKPGPLAGVTAPRPDASCPRCLHALEGGGLPTWGGSWNCRHSDDSGTSRDLDQNTYVNL